MYHAEPPAAHVRHLQAERREERKQRKIVKIAHKLVGIPYRWGGTTPSSGFDCSGLVQFILRRVGVSVPRTTYAVAGSGRPVYGRLHIGDVILFNRDEHEALYIGDGLVVESPHTGTSVHIRPLDGYESARRFF